MTTEETYEVYGLVLAGGHSTRMGQDKGLVQWHGMPQRYYMAGILAGLCSKVFISCRQDQAAEIEQHYPTVIDAFPDTGPLGAILSALAAHPHKAWLVVACDLPLLDAATLQYLLQHRDPAAVATTYKSPHDGLPEPLVTLWEPASLPLLLEKANAGLRCPRKVLLNSHTHIINPPDGQRLMNANTPDEAAVAAAIIAVEKHTQQHILP